MVRLLHTLLFGAELLMLALAAALILVGIGVALVWIVKGPPDESESYDR